MKKLGIVFSVMLFVINVFSAQAQTADEIINTYITNIGGAEKFKSLTGTKMEMNVNYQGMEIPVELVQLKGGKMYLKINFQGQEITQMAFDGTTAWSTNFMTMKAEKMESEMVENIKLEAGDYPDPLIDYKAKGYTAEYLGKETKEGTECYKVKVTKKPQTIDGQKVDNVVFYYFDTENNVPILTESEIKSGPMKGQMSVSTMSDYQEVEGMYFPFSMNQGGQPMKIKKVTLNPTVDPSAFTFKE
ncbi:MAG TPA: outer membrane lipoprotein-sorting protein [Flavobacterium sp.]|uniref:outer membrane lipoprotein-sorting protein n=1 Tax=unclassified Flavobacterium TaxID=196869 RepID=UPI0025C4443E|nr:MULTISPECIES: outer membrane lipoprotein-sorting protein [unclassified Flavobacterium]HRE78274.1 outer membrane lipoprotein-sorting protein [Flavobacterium sp.]